MKVEIKYKLFEVTEDGLLKTPMEGRRIGGEKMSEYTQFDSQREATIYVEEKEVRGNLVVLPVIHKDYTS